MRTFKFVFLAFLLVFLVAGCKGDEVKQPSEGSELQISYVGDEDGLDVWVTTQENSTYKIDAQYTHWYYDVPTTGGKNEYVVVSYTFITGGIHKLEIHLLESKKPEKD